MTEYKALDELTPQCPENIPRGYYRHFKGQLYWSEGVGKHSEDQTPLVAYRPFDELDTLWVRPVHMWYEHLEDKELENGELYTGWRFTYLGPQLTREMVSDDYLDALADEIGVDVSEVPGEEIAFRAQAENFPASLISLTGPDAWEVRRRVAWFELMESCDFCGDSQCFPKTSVRPEYIEMLGDHECGWSEEDQCYVAKSGWLSGHGATADAARWELGYVMHCNAVADMPLPEDTPEDTSEDSTD